MEKEEAFLALAVAIVEVVNNMAQPSAVMALHFVVATVAVDSAAAEALGVPAAVEAEALVVAPLEAAATVDDQALDPVSTVMVWETAYWPTPVVDV